MVITISEGRADSYILLSSKDSRFQKEWGAQIECRAVGMYKNLALISAWANNVYNEECIFEVD